MVADELIEFSASARITSLHSAIEHLPGQSSLLTRSTRRSAGARDGIRARGFQAAHRLADRNARPARKPDEFSDGENTCAKASETPISRAKAAFGPIRE